MRDDEVHPMFDPDSLFAAMVADIDDNGIGRIVKLFHDLRRDAIRDYLHQHPEDANQHDWGYAAETNALLTKSVRDLENRARSLRQNAVPRLAASGGDVSAAICCLGIEVRPDPIILPSRDNVYTEAGRSPAAYRPQPVVRGWHDVFQVRMSGLMPSGWGMLLLLTRGRLEKLCDAMALTDLGDPQDVVAESLKRDVFTRPAVLSWWASSPMSAVRSDNNGGLNVAFPLGSVTCPGLPLGSAVVAVMMPPA